MRHTILFCSQTASPIGGVETWLDRLCGGLDPKRWHPIVGLVRGVKAHRPEAFIEAHPGLETVEIDGRGMTAEGRIRAVMRCIKYVNPDIFVPLIVIDAHDAICRLKLQRPQTKYVMTIRGNVPEQIADVQRYKEFTDLAVCPGELTCRLLAWAGVPRERIRHVPNGARKPHRNHVPRPPEMPIRLGYVGRMTRYDKRVLDLILFCQHLERQGVHFSLDLVGDGPERATLEKALSGKGSHICFHGAKSLDVLYESIYPNLDALLLFSASEAFGIAVVEAMLHGVVPMTSRFVGHRAEGILIDGVTGLLFDVGDVEKAAVNVRELVEHPEYWVRLSNQAKDRVYEHYTWQRCIQGWEEAFTEVLTLPARTGTSLPYKDQGQKGRLDQLGVPPVLTDLLRRTKRRLFGVPQAMMGGEEWPWINKDHDPALLTEIERLARTLDRERNP